MVRSRLLELRSTRAHHHKQPSISRTSDILDQAIASLLQQNHSLSEVQAILRQKWEAIASPAVAQPRSSATVRLPLTINTSTLGTSPLKTVTAVSAPPRPPKDLCLSNLYQIEQDHGPFSNGYLVIHVGSSYSDVGGCKIYRGDVQQQQFQCKENLVYPKEADGAPRRLFDDVVPFIMPAIPRPFAPPASLKLPPSCDEDALVTAISCELEASSVLSVE